MKKLFSIIGILAMGVYAEADVKPDIEQFKQDFVKCAEYLNQNNLKAALPLAEKVYKSAQVLYDEKSKNRATATHNYGVILLELNQDKEARKILEEALALSIGIYGKGAPELISIYMDLGRSTAHKAILIGELSKINFDKALKITKKNYGDNSIEWATYAIQAGSSMLYNDNSPSGLKYIKKAHKILTEKLGENAPQTGYTAFTLGKYYLALNKNKTAIALLNQALATFEKPDEPSSDIELSTHAFLVQAYERQGKQEEATRHCMAIGRMTPFRSTQDFQPIFKPKPRYPSSASSRRKEGWFVVAYDVDEMGFTKNHKIIDYEGSDSFIEPVIESAKKYRYAPAFKEGKPVLTSNVRTRVIFQMAD